MLQVVVVTSPFIDEDNQLFYEASFNRINRELSIKIFSHRGVLKNKRTMLIEEDINDLFTAEEYLIGLNENHHKIFILDVRKHVKWMVTGELNSQSGMTEKMRSHNQKFSFFYYDRKEPLIFGVFDKKHVFYFRVNNLGSFSTLSKQKNGKLAVQTNKKLQIGKIHTSSESISKLEVQYSKRKVFKFQSRKGKSVILRPIEQKELLQNSRLQKQDKECFDQKVTKIYLLVQEKRVMRVLSVVWNDKVECQFIEEANVYDFCFRNGWDLIVKYVADRQGKAKMRMNQDQKFQFQTNSQGQYNSQIELSGNHKIFCSDQTLLLIDPQLATIVGVQNRQFRQLEKCDSIPKSIDLSTTLLMIERPDQFHLRFMFYVFHKNQSCFETLPTMVLLYKLEDTLEEEIYLEKNIGRVFTPNGLIHPYFKEKILTMLNKLQSKSSDCSPNNSFQEQRIRQQMSQLPSQIEVDNSGWQQNPVQLAKYFLNRIVFRSSDLLNKVLYALCGYGLKVLFQNKYWFHLIGKQPAKTEDRSLGDISKNKDESLTHNQHSTESTHSIINHYRCNFDAWNEYFEEIIVETSQLLRKQLIQNGQQHLENGNQFMKKVFQKNQKIKSKLIMLSNIYNRFLAFITTSQIDSTNQLNKTLTTYKFKILSNLNTIHSLFLIYDLLHLSIFDGDRPNPKKYLSRMQNVSKTLFQDFYNQNSNNITQFKQNLQKFNLDNQQNSSKQSNQQPLHGLLQFHQYFNNARQFNFTSSNNSFKQILEYLLSNLNQFQEVAYFYFIIEKQLKKVIEQEQRAQNFNRNKGGSTISQIGRSLILEGEGDRFYPYMSEDLVEFFKGIVCIEMRIQQNWSKQRAIQGRQKVQKLSRLSLKLNVTSFKLYMIQLSAQYKLPFILIQLVDSLKIQPYITEQNTLQEETPNPQSPKISRHFVQNQTIILKSLVHSALISQDKQYSTSLKQLLFYAAKRILFIYDSVKQNSQPIKKTLNPTHLNQQNSILITQIQTSVATKLKNHLLEKLVKALLFLSKKQSICYLEDLKHQCLTSQEDREFLQQIIEKNTQTKERKTYF